MRPELARVPGAGRIEVLASDTREIEVVLDPMKLTAAGLTVSDVADALKAQNQLQPVGRFSQSGQQHLSLASGLWTSVERDRRGAGPREERRDRCASRTSGRCFPGSPDRTLLITGNGRDAVSISISQQIGANILSAQARRRRRAGGADEDAAGRPHASPRSTTSPSSSAPRSPTSATPS